MYLTSEEATALFAKFCTTTTKVESRVNKAWLGRMVTLWDNYSRSIGKNGYALYNALTHYGTHSDKVHLSWRCECQAGEAGAERYQVPA